MAISETATYELLPLEDVTFALDVQGNSTANSANVHLWTRNGTNAQKWLFERYTGTTDVWYLKDAETGKVMEVNGGQGNDRNGANVTMYKANGQLGSRWKAVRVGTQAVNGVGYETYQFLAYGGVGPSGAVRAVDVQGDGAYLRSNVQIYSYTAGSPSQTFVLFPTEWNATGGSGNDQTVLPTPADGGAGTERGERFGKVGEVASGTVYPSWKCAQRYYQVRYRTRTRAAGATALSDWGVWHSISDGLQGYDGWGEPGEYNCAPTRFTTSDKPIELWSDWGVEVDNTSTYDRTDIQFSVRSWVANWGVGSTASAHGGEYAWTVPTVRPVSITSVTATYSPDGLRVGWVSDSTRGGMGVTIDCDLFGQIKGTGDASDYLTVPVSQLTEVPSDGDVWRMLVLLVTEDGAMAYSRWDVPVTYTGGSAALTLTAETVGTVATVSASADDAQAWLVIPRSHGDRLIPLPGEGPWRVAPPLGVDWHVYAVAGDDSTWGSRLATFDPIPTKGYHVTSQDLETDVEISYGLDSPVSFAPKYQRSHDSAETYGRERPVYTAGNVTSADWTVGGVLKGGGEQFDWLAHAGHVYFRGPRGFWAQALVTDAEIDLSRSKLSEVSASFVEEVW